MTVANDYVSQNVFDAQGHTGNTYYYRIVGNRNSQIWNAVLSLMELGVSWLQSAISLAELAGTGEFPVTVPGELPAGVYDFIVYHQAGSEPAETDDVEKQWTEVKGDIFGF